MIGVAPNSVVSIAGAFMLGAFGSLVLTLVPIVLAARHRATLSIALGEAALAASLGGTLAPLVVSWSATTVLGWRGAASFILVLVGALALVFRRVVLPPRLPTMSDEPARLPLTYWAYWLALLFAIAVEFCIVLWSASFLEQVVGMSRATAASGVSVSLIAVLLARLAGSRIATRWASIVIFKGSLWLTMLGVGLYWGVGTQLPALIGLALADLGVANLYPHGVALVLAAAPDQIRLASARASLTSGLAIMGAPLLLGNLVDRIGISRAHMVIVLFLVLAFGACQVATRLHNHPSDTSHESTR